MSENTTTTTGTRAARKEQAAMKKTAAKPAPAKAAAKTAAATEAKKAPTKAAGLRWEYLAERGKGPQKATAEDGTTYEIKPAGDKWQAVVVPAGGKPQVLTDKPVSIAACYGRCVKHFKGDAANASAA